MIKFLNVSHLHFQVCFIENTTLIVLWWILKRDEGLWFHYPALIGQFASFALSIALLGVYYKCLHPNLLLPTVGICTKNGPVCLSDANPPMVNGVPSPRSSPMRLGRLDIHQPKVNDVADESASDIDQTTRLNTQVD